MPRQSRVVAVGAPHHITQRGNNRQDVFLLDHDRSKYLTLLSEECRRCGVVLLGYCLMTNHVHLVAVPERRDSLACALRHAHSRYAQWFNRRYQRTGHLWQNRFFSSSLDRHHLIAALAYGDLNPVRAGLVRVAEDYPWSSARAHVEQHDLHGLVDFTEWRGIRGIDDWSQRLRHGSLEGACAEMREATYRGVPLGDRRFIQTLEQQAGRSLKLRSRGRPPDPSRRRMRSQAAAV